MQIEGSFFVPMAQPQLYRHLLDARLLAECLPGCESIEPAGDDRYRAAVAVGLGGIRARFNVTVEITRRDEPSALWTVTRGEEGGRASTLNAQSVVELRPEADGTRVDYRSDVSLSGRMGRFALGVMKKKAQSIGDEFARNLRERLTAGAAAGDGGGGAARGSTHGEETDVGEAPGSVPADQR